MSTIIIIFLLVIIWITLIGVSTRILEDLLDIRCELKAIRKAIRDGRNLSEMQTSENRDA